MKKLVEILSNGWGRLIAIGTIVATVLSSHYSLKANVEMLSYRLEIINDSLGIEIEHLKQDFKKHECASDKVVTELKDAVKDVTVGFYEHLAQGG